jgi:Flp pilus assembly protein TadG
MLLPILLLLTFGAIEYGLIYGDELKITTAARSGARIGVADKSAAGMAVNADDDWQILQAVYAALGKLGGKVVYISIYNAGTNPNGAPPSGCTGAGAASQTGWCNVYVQADLTMTAAQLAATTNYQAWPPSSRSVALNTSTGSEPTYLGVEVETTHNYISGLFGSSRTILERSVFRFEPASDTSHCNCIPPQPGGASTTTTTAAPTTTTTTGGGGGTTTTTHAPTTTTTIGGTTTTAGGGGTTTTHAPTTTTTHAPTTTPTTGGGGGGGTTTTSTTSQIVVIPT